MAALNRATDISCLVIVFSPQPVAVQGSGRTYFLKIARYMEDRAAGNSTVPEGIAQFPALEAGHYECLSCRNDYQFD
jgi:hypothetical protein